MMNETNYTIGELAQAAEVTPRTIRYYVAEALLPPPLGNGRAALYTEEHRDRLQLIKILKDEFLPLQEIRTLLDSLDHEAVLELLAERQQGQEPPSPTPNSAKNYLQTLLAPPPAPSLMRHKAEALAREAEEGLPPAPAAPKRGLLREEAPAAKSQEAAGYWQRLKLAPGVELHVQVEPADRQRHAKIEQLVKVARQLLSSSL